MLHANEPLFACEAEMSRSPVPEDASGPTSSDDLINAPEMRELTRDRRRFFATAWTTFLGAAAVFFGIPAVAPGAFGTLIVPGLPLGAVLAVAYTALVFLLAYLYRVRAARWDELATRLRDAHHGPKAES
jgi:uncharacterized membrane protein (DUF485 family)